MITRISASAGSGKTYTLTRIFLQLLDRAQSAAPAAGCALHGSNCGYSLPEILAATFTNKAAAEMKSRVVSSLKLKALEERAAGNVHGTAGQWVDRILRHYGNLNIRTIDSLLVTLVRLSALELGLSPEFEPSFDPAEYYTPAYDSLMDDLARAADAANAAVQGRAGPPPSDPFFSPAADATAGPTSFASAGIFPTADAATLRAALERACRAVLFLSNFSGFTPRNVLHDMLLALTERLLAGKDTPPMDADAIYARLNALHTAVRTEGERLAALLTGEGLKVDARFLTYLRNCLNTQARTELPKSTYAAKEHLDECLNKASKGAASAAAEAAFSAFAAAAAAYATSLPLFRHALQLAPLVLLANELHARMLEEQKSSGILPATCLPGLAAGLLNGETGVSDALCRFGTRLSRILLDEFQDTSREQWAAVLPLAEEALSTGGGLTYVGDVKQAIYGWRGGDAHLFQEASDDPRLTGIAGPAHTESLPCNWRSRPEIVRHNNAFFSLLSSPGIARAVFDATLPKETPDTVVDAAAAEAVAVFSGAAQALPPGKEDNSDASAGRAGAFLYTVEAENVETVQALVRERLARLFAEDLLPHRAYGDIAVLVHSGKEGALVASWLTDRNIPVVTENSFLLAAHPLVSRLIAFLTFLDYPLDDPAFWEFAGSPECLPPSAGLAGSRLNDWLAGTALRYPKKRPPLYQLFRQEFPEVWERWIAPFYSGAGLMSAYDTLQEAIRHFDLPRRQPGQVPFLRRLLELAHLAESRGHSSLAAFLAFWRGCEENEKLPLPESMDAVRIMTIHKAKGLEFPVVVLPFHHHGKRRDPELVAVRHMGLDLLTKAGRELPEHYYPACVTDDLERLNLLYVAWTRPVEELHAFITRPAKYSTPLKRALDVLMEAYADGEGRDLCRWETLSPAVEEEFSGEPELEETDMRERDPLRQPRQGDDSARPVPRPSGAVANTPASNSSALRNCDSPAPPTGEYSDVPFGEAVGQYNTDSRQELSVKQKPGTETQSAFSDAGSGGIIPPAGSGAEPRISSPASAPSSEPRRLMDRMPRLKIFRSPLPDPHFTPRRRGILVHLCLEHLLPTPGGDAAAIARDAARAVRQGMRLYPLPLPEPETIAASMEEALRWFAALPQTPLWLQHGLREQGIMDEDGRMHRVDLLVDTALYPDADGSEAPIVAIDYKTGRSGGNAQPDHPAQVRRYMALAQDASGRPVQGFLVYLDEFRLVPVEPAESSGNIVQEPPAAKGGALGTRRGK